MKDDGPAFPLDRDVVNVGMTLRDYFAAKAMQGLISAWTEKHPPAKTTSAAAYEYADAMLKAREK